MESIFLILSGAVLAAGILYWLWSHIQLTQKKVQLLENAVFELRGLQQMPQDQPRQRGGEVEVEEAEVPAYRDVDDNDNENDADADAGWQNDGSASTPLSALESAPVDLQPGGRIDVPAQQNEVEADKDTQFRELFIQHESRIPTPSVSTTPAQESSLESMPVKELRRLAEQRGLTGVSDMRKKELVAALRNQVAAPSVSGSVSVSGNEVVVERTLDLTDEAIVLE
jgi:hypothetical protein